MNSLSSTVIYDMSKDSNIFKTFNAVLVPNEVEKYRVRKIWYDYYLKIFKGYKYPLAKAVVELSNTDKIVLVNYGDPENAANPIVSVQAFIPSFIIKTKDAGVISCCNISHRAKYIRNKISNDVESLKLTERELYTFLQTAATNYIVFTKSMELADNTKFAKLCAELYSNLLARCINKTYPISAERNDIITLNFFCAIYCLQVMFGYDEEKAINYALTLRNVDKAIVTTSCTQFGQSLAMKNINDFIRIVEEEFKYIRKGSITYRNLTLMYTRMYGQNAIFAIEHFFSWLTMVQQSTMRIGMYSDGQLDNVVKPYVKDIETILFSVSGL